jgi:DNA-binding NtrC family response regulator
MQRLLVVDDESNLLYALKKYLSTPNLEVFTAATAQEALRMVQQHQPDTVILDVRLPDMSGLDAYDRIRQLDPLLPVIVITAFARSESAIEAMRRGAFEYLLKPVDYHQLQRTVAKALEVRRLSKVPAIVDAEESTEGRADRIVGRSDAMQEVYKAIGRAAPQDITVLVEGESGTGKELVARAIYHYSRRSQGPFLAINCAALPEALLESELFGHERGAFTGADQRRLGMFEHVSGGTIFLDEIGDMSMATQAKILRLLQEQRFQRVGASETIHTDVRVITATNKDLATLVEEGSFRQDLFYRLNGFTIRIPPLRQRREDLPVLTRHFIHLFDRELNKQVRALTPEAEEIIAAHDWPGNVRELQSAIKYAMLHATGDTVTADNLPDTCKTREGPERMSVALEAATESKTAEGKPGEAKGAAGPEAELPELARMVHEMLEQHSTDVYRQVALIVDRVVLDIVLQHVKGNQLQAAELLGMSRTTLRTKLRALGMTVEKQLVPDER